MSGTQVLIRNLDPELMDILKEQAKENAHSLESELRSILEEKARLRVHQKSFLRKMEELSQSFEGDSANDTVFLLRELREES